MFYMEKQPFLYDKTVKEEEYGSVTLSNSYK